MLCRTAADLYWLSRHMERVDNTARLIDLAHRIALLPERPSPGLDNPSPWGRALDALGRAEDYALRHGALTPARVQQYLILDADNPSSIYAAVHAARESGRAQRGAITSEMYEELNSTWLRVRDLDFDQLSSDGLSQFLDWVKRRAGAFRGVTLGTMGRGEANEFLKLGTFLERADSGVRLLDVNFSDPRFGQRAEERSAVEYYQMSALLQSLSAFETFRRVYRDVLTPARVAELVILNQDLPRSLARCSAAIRDAVMSLATSRRSETARLSGIMAAEIAYGRIEDVLAEGLPSYLARFLDRLYKLADAIRDEFLLNTDVVTE